MNCVFQSYEKRLRSVQSFEKAHQKIVIFLRKHLFHFEETFVLFCFVDIYWKVLKIFSFWNEFNHGFSILINVLFSATMKIVWFASFKSFLLKWRTIFRLNNVIISVRLKFHHNLSMKWTHICRYNAQHHRRRVHSMTHDFKSAKKNRNRFSSYSLYRFTSF